MGVQIKQYLVKVPDKVICVVKEMSVPIFNNHSKIPNEILLQILSHLDTRSLMTAGKVCKKWSDIVQIIHDKAWNSLTKAVLVNAEIIGPVYKERGWVEHKHSWNICKCINISRDLVPYDDNELLDKDMKHVGRELKKYSFSRRVLSIEDEKSAEASSRLAAAGILQKIDILSFVDVDLSHVKNLRYLARIAREIDFTGDIFKIHRSNIFNHFECERLHIKNNGFLTDGGKKILTEALNDRVKFFYCNEGKYSLFPNIENYDGRGKCSSFLLEYDSKEVWKSDHKKVGEWARSRGWEVKSNRWYRSYKLNRVKV